MLLLASLAAFADPTDLFEDSSDISGHSRDPLALPTRDHDSPRAVTNGDDVARGDWPDTAGIMFGGGYYVECTGVLVAPDVVLTAGHCADGIRAVLLDSVDWSSDQGEVIEVAEIHEYPNSWASYDITALVLAEPSTVEPRVIATDCIRDDIRDGNAVVVVGYGATDARGYEYTSKLQEGTTEITDADCSDVDKGCNASVTPDGEIGAGGPDGVDACYGDSGGPLYLPTDRGTYLAGITSRGWYGAECGDGGVWVRPDAVMDWIEEVTGRTLPRPVCGEPPRPVAPPLYAHKNREAITLIEPRDPDSDSFTFEIIEQALSGGATVDAAGQVTYHPEDGFLGEDRLIVRVTDSDGLSGDAEIVVKVMKGRAYRQAVGKGCGCDQQGAGGAGLLAGLLVALGVRVRGSRSRKP